MEAVGSPDAISILCGDNLIGRAYAVFASPVEGQEQQGLIKMWSAAAGQQGKHVLHTLAQRALVGFEEEELEVDWQASDAAISVVYNGLTVSFSKGLVLAMDRGNRVALIAQESVDVMLMLRAFHRYATRMIRLDVRS